jgi:tetratricopeptide (TPR) repeat protein
VAHFEGYVAQYLGDGMLALYGYPAAHENEAERAVRTGLEIIGGVAALNAGRDAKGLPVLAARVGIHAGPVVVGDSDYKSANVFGDTPNMAGRVQAAAERNTVVVSAAVYQLVSGWFDVEDLGPQTLKRIANPVQLYRVIQPSVVRRRNPGVAARVLTPFVGREEETRLLLSRWERVLEGQGQVVLVVGEPGIGKSRLVEEFRARIKDDPHLWIEGAGEQSFANTPFHTLSQMLDQILGWRADESGEERVSRLQAALELVQMKLSEAVPLIAEMLNLPIPEKYPPLMFAPDQKRRRLMANLADWMINTTRTQPMVIAIEDQQWVDPSTLELINSLVEQSATVPLLLLSTARPEFRAPWPMRAHHVQITLTRLNDRHTLEMVANLAAGASLKQDVIDTVVMRTDGVPLFAEELTRLLLEGSGREVLSEIPATLQNSLMARLDHLGPGKEVARLAAVIGREFSYELLEAISPLQGPELQAALASTTDAELIYPRGTPPNATYQFKHALVHDAAYEALLKSRRRELHRRVAQVLSDRFPALAETRPEMLAHHWTEGGDAEAAVAAWKNAGESADSRRAFKEAEEDYRRALEVLRRMPPSSARDGRELELTSALERVLLVTKGYSATETASLASHARELAEQNGNLAELVLHGYGAWNVALVSGDHAGAMAIADSILGFAQRDGTSATLAFAHAARLGSSFFRGEPVGCEEHLAFWSPHSAEPVFRQFPGAFAHVIGQTAINAWTMGHADVARERMARGLAFARDTNRPLDLAAAHLYESWLHLRLRETEQASDAARRALAISETHGVSWFAAVPRAMLGAIRARLGAAKEGLDLIKSGLTRMANQGGRLGLTENLIALAGAQALDGSNSEALKTIDETLEVNPEEAFAKPEALRFRGELRLEDGQTESAEADFRHALALARKMTAKAWEPRAAMSLARLLLRTNRRDEGRVLLQPIYNWFTEGFDTADLKDAKALLDELSNRKA